MSLLLLELRKNLLAGVCLVAAIVLHGRSWWGGQSHWVVPAFMLGSSFVAFGAGAAAWVALRHRERGHGLRPGLAVAALALGVPFMLWILAGPALRGAIFSTSPSKPSPEVTR